jgi:hypothetical protein
VAGEFVSSARPASGEARKGTVSARAVSLQKFPQKISRDFLSAGVRQIQAIGGAMQRRPKRKESNMKTRTLLMTIGAAALTAITLNVIAGDIALSPRAAANQIKTVPSVAAAQPAQPIQADQPVLSPRAAANQSVAVKGTETSVVKCSAAGSPKYLAAVGNAARTTCCKSTLAECPTMGACGSAK